MFNYVLNFYIKNNDILKIDDILTKINNGEFDIYELENVNILKMTKKFPDNYSVTLEVNYDNFIDDLEFNVRLESPNDAYIEEVVTVKSFNSSYFFEGENNLYTINILDEEDRFNMENILDIVLAERNNN